MSLFYQKIFKITSCIPRGKVATYGQIAGLVSAPRAALLVGRALHNLINQGCHLPWQRVVNAQGFISTTCKDHPAWLQKKFLEREGVEVKQRRGLYWVDLKKYLWKVELN